jgi:hypothetical protein
MAFMSEPARSLRNVAERAAELEDALDSLVAEAGHLLRKKEYWMLVDAIEVLKGIQKRMQPQVTQFVRVKDTQLIPERYRR